MIIPEKILKKYNVFIISHYWLLTIPVLIMSLVVFAYFANISFLIFIEHTLFL